MLIYIYRQYLRQTHWFFRLMLADAYLFSMFVFGFFGLRVERFAHIRNITNIYIYSPNLCIRAVVCKFPFIQSCQNIKLLENGTAPFSTLSSRIIENKSKCPKCSNNFPAILYGDFVAQQLCNKSSYGTFYNNISRHLLAAFFLNSHVV